MPKCSVTNSLILFSVLAIVSTASAAAQDTPFVEVTDEVLQNPDPSDWLRWRRDQNASAFSPLSEITRENVSDLRLAWAWAMPEGRQEQEPIVYNGIMYLPSNHGLVQALDGRSGDLIWEYRRDLPEGMGDETTRNLAIYQDKIFLTTEDAYLVALNARTGELVWEVQTGDLSQRIRYTSGPIAGDGKVFAGLTCGADTSSPCFLSAHDAETGTELWRRESIAGPTDPAEHNATWGGVPYEQRKKSSFWLTGSYDSELGLVYWTTASASPYPEMHKGSGSGSLYYSNSILALEADSGEIRWFFQMQPRDNFDMDHQDNPILADVEIDGIPRKIVTVLGKPGIQWAFDRVSGEYLWHKQLVSFQNLYENIDSQSGAITMNESLIPDEVGDISVVCPGVRGGKLFQTKAYDPTTATLFSPVSNECTEYEVIPLEEDAAGVQYNEILHMEGSNENVGRLAAIDAATGDIKWIYDQRAALGSILATGGGLVFAADLHRYFKALDSHSGEVLWEIPLSAPIASYPISYAANGKQYVAVAVGGRTPGTAHLAELYPELKSPSGSNILMVFSLGD
jgi:PQQ-dependent dehydrogenase (methanol/ethanol family)